ncbi:hypothetical protein ASC77_16680 [Nocardioides sp. Root1257]|uniref:hypothetical protein n=1 Tax=unclassified Nocardioides TaxID=2615069 RepID=UPI0006FBB477|nr:MULTISPECIES: hypothetical protein [unclassified Nocardioides]KQW48027.1 hypothetical protein ASC77_16680 [Nocardioides sp. Root1257]KRC45279.1 hypothetical protein ASE24_17630 [Nocardioides sp. Root224]
MSDGDRLADWLEGLGLVDALAEAGLPTFTRDASGHAVWSEPDRVEELDRLLHSEGTEPEHAVPVGLLLIARQARLRTALLETPWFGYETLAEVRGASVDATRYAVHKAAQTHRLLVVPVEGGVVVPGFQLTDEGEVRPDVAPLLEPLLASGMDPWRAWAWLTQPAALTFGQAPEEAVTDPDLADLVRHAAVRLAERVHADS